MVNKEGLERIKQEAIEIHENVYDSYNTISRRLLSYDPENIQLKTRLESIMKQLDMMTASKKLILSVEDGLEAETKGIEEELSNMRNNREEIIRRLEKAEKDFK